MALVMPHSIFIHIPKTGGSWVRRVVRAMGMKNAEAGEPRNGKTGMLNKRRTAILHCSIKAVPKEIRLHRYVFFCIRHPVSWLCSYWSYATRDGQMGNPGSRGSPLKRYLHKDLNTFLERVIDSGATSTPTHAMFHRIGWQVVNDKLVDTIKQPHRIMGRTESLATDFEKFLKTAGERYNSKILLSFPHQRVSNSRQKQQVSTELAHRICEANKVLMEIGGY